MAEFPADCRYAETHEWARAEDDGRVIVGISDFAQESLGDIVYVELPEVGSVLGQGDEAGVVESVKAAGDLYAPVAGEIVAVNEDLEDAPEIVNESPFEKGWIFKLQPSDASLAHLLDAEGYRQHCESMSD